VTAAEPEVSTRSMYEHLLLPVSLLPRLSAVRLPVLPDRHQRREMSQAPMILVLCTGNSCRSQMAEAFLRKHQGDRFTAASAGTQPKAEVHPLAVRVMKEIGTDISQQKPKDVKDFLGKQPVRHVLIVCDNANESCPRIWPGAFSRTFMPFDDPAEATGSEDQKLAVFRRVRDEIDEAMKTWVPQS
jgi:arsenate reductase (thioredoxin)